jgi:broad specificity phosphatase PhoE
MAHLYLVRHAQPDFARNYDSITALGAEQSAWLGAHFAALGLRFERIVSGSLVRQRETLRALADVLDAPGEPRIDARFNEYDAAPLLGQFGGGDDAGLRAAGDRRAYFIALRTALLAWSRHAGPIDGGETWQAFGARVDAALGCACGDLPADARVLIVTSGGVIGRAVADLLRADAEAAVQLNLQARNTGITEIARGRSGSRLVAFNAVPHLEQPDRLHAVTWS